MTDFAGNTALVTGAASGIGAAAVRWLARNGAVRLILIDRDEGGLDRLAVECAVTHFVGDVADPALWERVEAEAGPLDCAVLNAGVSSGGPIADLPFEEWRRVLAVNLDGTFLSLRTAMRLLRDGGSAVLTASVSGQKAEPGTAAYGASKAGVIQLAKVAAKEGAARGIRVNAIAPGGVDTPIWDDVPFFQDLVAQHEGDRDAALAAMAGMATPLGRYASADEVAAQIGFLLSGAAATITGAVLVSDGGYSL
ncbi:SDR family oxidoreductase [Altererythrobacter soli]|uniref:SDR family oxidoreductase n=1 Tax=Croceibacterium soli TaxID=1739690 RepID=A0A6I4V164_9SPHN|nr:SDR family oxidoreductase [Croceibacterium soli]MXP42735.1 SDR family oxidoreductase [Croceibacterium soli]